MGLVITRLSNESSTFQMSTDDLINFKDHLIQYYSVAQGAGVLQTIQAMQASSQPGAKQIPYQGLPWFGVTSTLFSIAPLTLAISLVLIFVTYFFAEALLFSISVALFVYFMVFVAMYKSKGLHQVVAQGGSIVFTPLIAAAIFGLLAYFWKASGADLIGGGDDDKKGGPLPTGTGTAAGSDFIGAITL